MEDPEGWPRGPEFDLIPPVDIEDMDVHQDLLLADQWMTGRSDVEAERTLAKTCKGTTAFPMENNKYGSHQYFQPPGCLR